MSKAAGLYSHPYFCDHIVHCGSSDNVAGVSKCTEGLCFDRTICRNCLEVNCPGRQVSKCNYILKTGLEFNKIGNTRICKYRVLLLQ